MKRYCLLFTLFFFHSFLFGMDSLVYSTNLEVKAKLDQAVQSWQKEMALYNWTDNRQLSNIAAYQANVASIVLAAREEDMSNIEKLQWLFGDSRYQNRKKIIDKILKSVRNSDEEYDPCTICYQHLNPLLDAIQNKDSDFVEHLLRIGAKPEEKEFTAARNSECSIIKQLLSLFEYNVYKQPLGDIFYSKNRDGDILVSHKDLPKENLVAKLSLFVRYITVLKNVKCIVSIPHTKGKMTELLKKVSFKYHQGDDDKTEWLFENSNQQFESSVCPQSYFL